MGQPGPPRPPPPPDGWDTGALQSAVEALLQHSAGCRALASATAGVSLPLPSVTAPVGPFRVPISRGAAGHHALYGVLLVLWRARARILRERRLQRAELERQLRQVDSLITVRQRNLRAAPVHGP